MRGPSAAHPYESRSRIAGCAGRGDPSYREAKEMRRAADTHPAGTVLAGSSPPQKRPFRAIFGLKRAIFARFLTEKGLFFRFSSCLRPTFSRRMSARRRAKSRHLSPCSGTFRVFAIRPLRGRPILAICPAGTGHFAEIDPGRNDCL